MSKKVMRYKLMEKGIIFFNNNKNNKNNEWLFQSVYK